MSTLVYFIGEPGVGKSTLMEELTRPLLPFDMEDVIRYNKQNHHVPYIMWAPPPQNGYVAYEIGYRRDGHSGTDVLGLHMSPVVSKWLKLRPHKLVLGEGDRLSGDRFFTAAVEAGYDLHIVWLYAGEKTLVDRREDRGTTQNATWLKGRKSKVTNLAERWDDYVMPLNAERRLSWMRDQLLVNIPALEPLA